MSSYSTGSSSERPIFDPTKEEEEDIQRYRIFIRSCKSLGCSAEDTSGTSTREVVSESFIDVLTKEEIDEFRKKLFSYWEKKTKSGEKSEDKVEDSKMALHQGSDPKIQYEEAVPSFEDAKFEVAPSASSHHDVGKLIETELRSIRETKLGEVEKSEVGKLRRSENIDFTELKKKAADLPVTTDLMSTQRRKQLPNPRKTDHLEMVLKVYDSTGLDPVRTLQYDDAKEAMNVSLVSKLNEDQEFRKHLVLEMRILYNRLVNAPKVRAPSIIEEAEFESSSSVQTKDSTFSSPGDVMDGSLGQSITEYPDETRESARIQKGDDTMANVSQTLESSSLSGLVNIPQFNIPDGAKRQSSPESENSSATTVFSDDTLSDISSLPTDTSGARTSVSSFRDSDALTSPLSKIPPQILIEDATDDEAFLTSPLTRGNAGISNLAVPQVPRLPSSLDDSTENAEAEDHGQRRRDRSPKEDENMKATKRQAI